MRGGAFLEADWQRETLRTNLWLVPAVEAAVAAALFACTVLLDRYAYNGRFSLPTWVLSGAADGARQILTTIAAAIITVVGLVFSITIVALTLASTQFGPRMLRNFIRDRGTQLTLGTFVATFFYTVLVLVAISPGPHGDFVPHLSITVSLALTVVDLAVLIYFIHHIATMIQLPQVIASIADDLGRAIETQGGTDTDVPGTLRAGPTEDELIRRIESSGATIPTTASGYLQYIRHERLVLIATESGAVLHLPYRTLTQDVSFGVDQLVEIAIRALSSAVNDTFTALTCIDWLSECLCRITTGWHPQRVHQDVSGHIRVIAYQADYDRLVQRAFEKIRQSAPGMPR